MEEGDAEKLAGRLLTAIESSTRTPEDDDERWRYEAVAAASTNLKRLMARTPWAVMPPAWLDGIQAAFDPVVASVESYVSAEQDEAPLPVTWTEIERMWAALTPLVPAVLPEESVSEDAASFRRSAGQLIRRLTDEVEAGEKRAKRLEAQLAELEEERDAAIAAIKQHQAKTEAAIAEQATRLDHALRENQEQFSAAQERRGEQFTEALSQHKGELGSALKDARSQAAAAVEAAEAKAGEVLSRIEQLEENARKSYNTIGNASVAGHYQSDADTQGSQANLWRWLAVGGFALVALGTIAELVASGGSLEWEQTRSRIPVVIALAAFATFAVAEAREHRRAERESRRREVELSSLDPFLVLIDDRQEAEAVKLAYARRVFVDQNGGSTESAEDDDE